MATVRRIPQHTPPPSPSDIGCPVRIYDATGNRFRGYRWPDPTNGNVTKYIVEKLAPNGTFVAAWEVTPRDSLKIGTSSATMCDMGTGIVVDMWVYDPTQKGARPWYPDDVFIADAGFERGTRLQERGGMGAVGNTGGNEAEMDWVKMGEMLGATEDKVVDRIVASFGGSGVRQGIEDKVKDSLRELNMHSASMQERGIDAWARDRFYEVLRDNGLLRP